MRHNLIRLLKNIAVAACVLGTLPTHAQDTTVLVPVFPKYTVLGVVYAPPGASSSVTYGNSTMVGSTQSYSQSSQTATITSSMTTVGGGLFGLAASHSTTTSSGWTTAFSSTGSVAIQTTTGNSIASMGPISSALGVNHDNDVIYILLNPVATFQVTASSTSPYLVNAISWFDYGMAVNGCDASNLNGAGGLTEILNGCDPNQYPYPDVVGIPVWCLKNPYYPGQGCAQWLTYTSRSWDHSYLGQVSPSQLTNPYPANPAGLTLQDYADILQADPFVALNGSTINPCHWTYGPDFDPNELEHFNQIPPSLPAGKVNPTRTPNGCGPTPNGPGAFTTTTTQRFQPYGSVEYPEPGPNGLPSTYTGMFAYSNTTNNGTTSSDTHTSGTSSSTTIGGSASLGLSLGGGAAAVSATLASFSAEMTSTNGTTLTSQNINSTDTSKQQATSASYSITGPQLSDNYTGPATYNVYMDNVYGTFAFYSNLEPQIQLGTIGISSSSQPNTAVPTFPSTALGSASMPIQITLTNNSIYPMTMVWPAVTFSDPGFTLVQNNAAYPDECSNQYLAASTATHLSTCTLFIQFVPQPSDAPNPITKPNLNVPSAQATMIAAGTENASSYQNTLVTAQTSVSGIVPSSNQQGALLVATGSSLTYNPAPTSLANATNVIPFVFVYPTPTAGTPGTVPQTQSFTFTNNYAAGILLDPVNPIILSDASDFSIQTSGNTCLTIAVANTPFASGQTCTFTVVFLESVSVQNPNTSEFWTNISMMGRVNGSATGVPSESLANAFAVAEGAPVMTAPAFITISSGYNAVYTLTNNTAYDAVASVGFTQVSASGQFTYYGCGTGITIHAGGSCTITFQDPGYDGTCGTDTYTGEITASGYVGTVPFYLSTNVQENIYPSLNCSCSGYCNNSVPVKLTPSTTGQTVSPGGTAQFAFQVAPTGINYPTPVSFSVSGLPAGATAVFSPTTLPSNSGASLVTLSIQTAALKAEMVSPLRRRTGPIGAAALLLLPFAVMFRRRARRAGLMCSWTVFVIVVCSGAATLGIGGCAGTNQPSTNTAQAYAVVVTATCNSVSQSLSFPLLVE